MRRYGLGSTAPGLLLQVVQRIPGEFVSRLASVASHCGWFVAIGVIDVIPGKIISHGIALDAPGLNQAVDIALRCAQGLSRSCQVVDVHAIARVGCLAAGQFLQ